MNCFKCILKYSWFLGSIYLLTLKETQHRITRVKKSAYSCGPLGMKLLQFLLMRKIFITKDLDLFLEDCPIHSLEKTKTLYFDDYSTLLEKDFEMIYTEPIGSGSIGQVYKVFDCNLNKTVALKVKHPGIDEDVKIFSKAIRIILKIFKWKWNHVVFEFINNINTQLDYNLEAENTIKLKEKFKDESIVIIPDVYRSSKNFIVMEYVPGKHFENCKNQIEVSLYITFIFLISVFCYDFLHGDLHFGNWKVTDTNKIVIYDSGICYSSGNLDKNKKIMTCVLNGNYKNLVLLFNPTKINEIDQIMDELELMDNSSAHNRIRNFLNKCIEKELVTDQYFINLLNCTCILGETQKISVDLFTPYIFTKGDSNAVMVYFYIDLLNQIGIFKELKTFFENWMLEDPDNKTFHNEWLMEKFGHQDSTIVADIIHEKIFCV